MIMADKDENGGQAIDPKAQADVDANSPAARSKKQMRTMIAGAYFVIISAFITRRAIRRRIKWAKPTYFRQNMHHPEEKFDGGLEAVEAFSVATVNVFSWGIFFTGGWMWATNTSGLEEMRQRLRLKLNLSEDDQRGSQNVVRSWIEAAKPWNAFKKEKAEATELEEEDNKDDNKPNERGPPSS
ncbi:hypothetical protein BT63DRAFT_22889 [Microthyrium microscopicum]|uniref:Altered inheritance of mitochondria protein 11 n=1 Tax=Microthyrium microscopicum TaxID=703497 RepID=A0A6A6USZ6_9PEZI|nr:hypothetical protein BT63DRAFT_22889 [Microthyrium microscopicum]